MEIRGVAGWIPALGLGAFFLPFFLCLLFTSLASPAHTCLHLSSPRGFMRAQTSNEQPATAQLSR